MLGITCGLFKQAINQTIYIFELIKIYLVEVLIIININTYLIMNIINT